MPDVQRRRDEAVRHQPPELDPGGRRRERADAERVEEIRDEAEPERLEVRAELAAPDGGAEKGDGEGDAEGRERGEKNGDRRHSAPRLRIARTLPQNVGTCRKG